jgi:hypothetical protein
MNRVVGLYLDAYERQARLAPGLMALLPVSITVVALGWRNLGVVSVVVGSFTAIGGPGFLADTVRGKGVNAQNHLYRAWGGMPTTQLLRLREPTDSPARRAKWRAAVETVTGTQLPNADSEASTPDRADGEIQSAVDDLRDIVRAPGPTLLNRENRAYGFRRNMFGIRWIGLIIALLCVVVTGLGLISSSIREHPTGVLLAIAMELVIALGWLIVPRARWVRAAADRYTYQLMQAAVMKSR